MPYCNGCGEWNPEGSTYCSGCGRALADPAEKYSFPGGESDAGTAVGDEPSTAEAAVRRYRIAGIALLAIGILLAVYGTFFQQLSVESMDFDHDLPFDSATIFDLLSGGAKGFGAVPGIVLMAFSVGGIICSAMGLLHSTAVRIGGLMIAIGMFMTFMVSYPVDAPEGTVYVDVFIGMFPHSLVMMGSLALVLVSAQAASVAERLKGSPGPLRRAGCKRLSRRQPIHATMPSFSCPNCGAEIAPFNGESPKFCMRCGFRLAAGDGSYAEPQSSGNALYDRIRAAVIGGTLVDHRSEAYDRQTAIDAFNRMARLEVLRTNEQMSAHFANACAVAAMVIANDPDPYLVSGMMGTLADMQARLMREKGMWQSGESRIKKCQDIRPYGRNVASLRTMLRGRNVAENRYAADAVRMRLAGDPAWQIAAARAADALMDISEADEKTSLLFGKNAVCKGAKAFEEYVRVLCGRPFPG